MLCVARFSCVPSYTFITLVLKKFSTVHAQIFAHMSGSHGISQFVPNRWARYGGTHRAVLQPCAATSVSHNSLPKPSVWVPGREFVYELRPVQHSDTRSRTSVLRSTLLCSRCIKWFSNTMKATLLCASVICQARNRFTGSTQLVMYIIWGTTRASKNNKF